LMKLFETISRLRILQDDETKSLKEIPSSINGPITSVLVLYHFEIISCKTSNGI
jgi:hypothetical protein